MAEKNAKLLNLLNEITLLNSRQLEKINELVTILDLGGAPEMPKNPKGKDYEKRLSENREFFLENMRKDSLKRMQRESRAKKPDGDSPSPSQPSPLPPSLPSQPNEDNPSKNKNKHLKD